jgi:hypothetical protein
VNALDQQDNNLNYLNLVGSVILPNGQSQEISFQQAAPGRYTTKVPAEEPGNYFLAVSDARGSAPVRAAVNVANTAELQKLTSYDGLLAELAEGKPKDGEAGKLIQASGGVADTAGLLKTNVFRPGIAPAKSRSPMWPIVLVAAGFVFLSDVFCRRVHVSFGWVSPLAARLSRSRNYSLETENAPMERLRRSKSGATARYAHTEAIARFESSAPTTNAVDTTDSTTPSATSSGSPPTETDSSSGGFTARLLEVKKHIRDKKSPRD